MLYSIHLGIFSGSKWRKCKRGATAPKYCNVAAHHLISSIIAFVFDDSASFSFKLWQDTDETSCSWTNEREMKAAAATLLSDSEMTIVTMLGFGNFRHLGPPPSFTLLFYPIWAYWACFAPGNTARHPFFIAFTTHAVRDAAPRETWLRTLHWWRKVGKDRGRRTKVHLPRVSNARPPDYMAFALPLCYNLSPTFLFCRSRAHSFQNHIQTNNLSWQYF